MTAFEEFQNRLLKDLGYDVAPFYDGVAPLFAYLGEDKFFFYNKYAEKSSRQLKGNRLVGINEDGYHVCQSLSKQGEPILHHPLYWRYYILWESDDYTELPCLCNLGTNQKDTFEQIETDNYFAIKYHKDKMHETKRLKEKPLLDIVASKKKEIYHIGVFTYYYKDKIVVYDDGKTIVYNSDLDVLYEKEFYYGDWDRLVIWECEQKNYLIFPPEGTVYDLLECKETKLYKDNEHWWLSAITCKDIFVLYSAHRFPVDDNSYYDDDGNYWSSDYNEEDIPIRNTNGHIFDSSFKLLREFNVIGEINQLKEMGDTIVMVVNSSSIEDNDTNAYYNVNAPNLTRHNNKTDEDFSVPDITFRDMVDFDSEQLVIVKTRVPASDCINLSESTKSQLFKEKCGVYYCVDWPKGIYKKIIECKYDYIKSLPIEDDHNIYYAGVVGLGEDNIFDLYINHKIVLQGIPFNRGHSVKLIKDEAFIQITNIDGKKGIIRNGEFILDPIYKEIRTFVHHERNYDPKTNITSETLKYLFVVADDEYYGICSPSGKLILPMKYSTIDMDNELCIVLVRDFNAEFDDESDETLEDMLDYGGIYETGYYDEEKDVIVTERARFKEGKVLLDNEDDYVWDGGFRYLKEDNYSGWTDQELRDAADIAYEGHSRLELGLED